MQPEKVKIVNPLVDLMEHRGWYTKKTHGSEYQFGLPDIYATHKEFGARWIECKIIRSGKVHFEQSQIAEFPRIQAAGAGIWIAAGTDFRGLKGKDELLYNYGLLFKPPNFSTWFIRSL